MRRSTRKGPLKKSPACQKRAMLGVVIYRREKQHKTQIYAAIHLELTMITSVYLSGITLSTTPGA